MAYAQSRLTIEERGGASQGGGSVHELKQRWGAALEGARNRRQNDELRHDSSVVIQSVESQGRMTDADYAWPHNGR